MPGRGFKRGSGEWLGGGRVFVNVCVYMCVCMGGREALCVCWGVLLCVCLALSVVVIVK